MRIESDDDNNQQFIVEDNIIEGGDIGYEPDPEGIGHFLLNCMQRNEYKVAQYLVDIEGVDLYGEFLQRCIRTAINITSRGLTKSDVICICSPNHRDTCVPYIAAMLSGVIVSCIDISFTSSDAAQLLKIVSPKLIFVTENDVSMVEKAIDRAELETDIVVFGETHEHTPFAYYIEPIEGEENFEAAVPEDLNETVAIFFSSGTTGLPKGITLSHYSLIVNPYNMTLNGTIEGNSVVICYSTLYWISATLMLLSSIYAGVPRVVCPHFDAEQLWSLIEKYRVTMGFLTTSQLALINKHGRPENVDTSSLNYILTGGTPIPMKLLKEIRDILPGAWIAQGYGSTETAATITCFRPNNVRDTRLLHYKPQSSGLPIPGFSYKIVDITTEELLGPYEQGELRLMTKGMTRGYYQRDSSDAYDSEGWLKTGDLVYYDEDFCFYVVDRLKELLKYRSWQVAPAMLESVLQTHPAVKQTLVIGLPHPEDGDHPLALVVLEDNYSDVTEEEILSFVNGQVSEVQQLRGGVKFIQEIPITPSGKVKRRELKNRVLAGEI